MNNKLSFNPISEKMVMAKILIPLALSKTGEIQYLNDYAQITFDECISLPEKQNIDINIDFSKLFNLKKDASCETDFALPKQEQPVTVPHVQETIETQTDAPEEEIQIMKKEVEDAVVEEPVINEPVAELALTIYKDEIKHAKRGMNNTFKNKKPKSSYNFTKKVT